MTETKAEVLVVVDMQNDFITGSLGSEAAQAIVPNVVEKVKAYREHYDLETYSRRVYFTQDTHFNDYLDTLEGKYLPVKHCIVGTNGIEICDELKKYVIDKGLYKNIHAKYSFGFLDLDVRQYKPGIYGGWMPPESIEIVGLCTDICVISNALILRAKYPKTKIYVDPTCCAGTKHSLHLEALNIMESCQIEII